MVVNYGENNEYARVGNCPKCDEPNETSSEDYIDGHILLECKTKCTQCGHENYWAHGQFIEYYGHPDDPRTKQDEVPVIKNPFSPNGELFCHCGKQVSEEQLRLVGVCEDCK